MDQSVLSGTCNSIFDVEIASELLKRAPPKLCNLFGRECNSTEVTKNRNGRQNRNGHLATKGIGMVIWPHLIRTVPTALYYLTSAEDSVHVSCGPKVSSRCGLRSPCWCEPKSTPCKEMIIIMPSVFWCSQYPHADTCWVPKLSSCECGSHYLVIYT